MITHSSQLNCKIENIVNLSVILFRDSCVYLKLESHIPQSLCSIQDRIECAPYLSEVIVAFSVPTIKTQAQPLYSRFFEH